MIKKILIISGVIFAILLLIFVFKTMFSDRSEKETSQEITGKDAREENVGKPGGQNVGVDQDKKMKVIVAGPIIGPQISITSGQIIFYQDQKFLTANFDGANKSSIGGYPFQSLEKIHWAPGQKEAIVKDEAGFFIYSLDQDEATKTKPGADEIIWSGDGRLFYKYFDPATKKRSLNISDKDGNNWKILVDRLGDDYRDTILMIQPGSLQNCFFPFPDGKNQGKLHCVSSSGDKKLIYEGNFGADYLWSPDGQKLLISSVQNQGGNRMVLGVMNAQGGEYRGLDFPTTVQKCAWSSDSKNVYCSMMAPVPEQAVLPNNWQSKKFEFEDISFWRIDTETAKKTRVLEAKDVTTMVDASNVFLDQQEEFLFFQDRKDDSLYRIDLR